ncbi:homoserine O-acetyltransferase/O-succinyltransferase family protein, partial [Bifidobacterium longum]
IYLCWGAMGALYYRYGIHKVDYPEKIFGVFPQYLQDEYCFLTNGFDEIDLQPHSRLAGVNENEVRANHDLQILTWGPQSGPGLIATRDFSEVFALGHWEYGKYTLAEEYERDMAKGMTNVPFPKNYFPHDDPKLEPLFAWRAHANLLWRNWLNWVYQTTPYDLTEVPQLRAEKKLGTDRSIRHEPGGPRQDDFKPFVHDGYGVIQG